jgi:tetratricopeptide (TPR) repeat protein
LETDVIRFRELVESPATDPSIRESQLEKAINFYVGDLLEGTDEEWCVLERNHLRGMVVSGLKELVQLYRKRAAYAKAIQVCRRIVAIDPIDEDAHRELMLLHHLNGDRSAALAQYQVINTTLQAELGVFPDAKTNELWRYIRSGAAQVPGRSLGYPSADAVSLASKSPIVGRDIELGRLLDGLGSALQGRGVALIVSGEAGIGKTRLIEAVDIEARLRGFEVLKGRCADLHAPAPYQAFIEALWPRISRKMHSDTPRILADFLANLSPQMRRGRRLPSSGPVASVINEMLLSLLDHESPTLVVIEDLQHADEATRSVVQLLGDRLSHRKMVLMLSVRSPVAGAGGVVGQFIPRAAAEVRLEPLGRSETDELINLTLGTRTIQSSVLSIIWNMTGGNPLAVTEYLRFVVERGHLVRTTDGYWAWANSAASLPQLPPRVQVLLRERVGALGDEARTLLLHAAVLGHEGDLQFLERLSGLGQPRFSEIVSQLFTSGILQETPRGYQFAHDSHRLASLSTVTPASRRSLHQKTAELMAVLWPARSEDLAWHFLEAGRLDKALIYAEASADKARAVHANENALRWYSKALELLPALTGEEELAERWLALLLRRQEVLELLGRCSQQIDDLDQIQAYATRHKDLALLARCHCLRARSLGRMNRNTDALRAAAAARRLYRSLDDPGGQARALEISAMIYTNLRDTRGVRAAFEQALSYYRLAHDRQGAARAASGIGTLMLFTGESKAGLAHLQKAEMILAKSSDRRDYAPALIQKGVFWRYLGHARKSEMMLIKGIELMKDQGDPVGEARGLSQLAYTHMIMGSARLAVYEARRSIRLATEAGDTRGEITFRNNAAYAVYRWLGEFDRAQRCVRQALFLVSETARKENQATYYDTMAAILYDKGDFRAAYQWAKEGSRLYRRLAGQFEYVGAEIDYHLGASALAVGRVDEAKQCLSRAVDHWERAHDKALLPRGYAQLGLVALAEGNIAEAEAYAHRIEGLLRRTRGVEEVQRVYWAQAQAYLASGHRDLSTRALRRAIAVVARQAQLLKGRLRRSYLSVPSNRRILEDAAAAGLSVGGEGPRPKSSKRAVAPGAPKSGPYGLVARRERLLELLDRESRPQHDLAGLLGVSERTVRSDIAALRNFGLLPPRTEFPGAARGGL